VHDAVVRASQGGRGSLLATWLLDGTGLYYWPSALPWRVVVMLFIVGEAWSRIFLRRACAIGVVAALPLLGCSSLHPCIAAVGTRCLAPG